MSASELGFFNLLILDANGSPAVGGRVYTFVQGTTTKKTAYTDAAASVAHTYTADGLGGEYIALNARGELPAPLFGTSGAYDIHLKTSAGATVWTHRGDPMQSASDLAATSGPSLIGFDATLNYAAGTIGEAISDVCINVKMFPWLATGDGVTNDSAAIQAAIDYINSVGGGTLIVPLGSYLLNTALTPCNFLTIQGVTATLQGAGTPKGTFFIAANTTGAFSAASIQKFCLRDVGFLASGSGVGTAYAYKQTTLTDYSQRCEFYNVNIWANMAGGFLGNFILTTWRRCEFGYYSAPVGQFWPIYSKGDIAGNQTNANLIEDCYVLNSLGSYTFYFEAGSDLTIRNTRFEHCDAVTTINLAGILVSNIEGCYFEDSNGATTAALISYANDTTAAQGCSAINFNGNYGSLSSNNTHLIAHSGASGSIVALGNRFEGLAGKNFCISASGNDKPFAAYIGNVTPSFSGIGTNIESLAGSWTPTIEGSSGTNVHTYSLQAGKYTRVGRLVIAHFRVVISAKDAGTGGNAYVGLTGLPTPATAPSEGWTGGINYTNGITYPAGTTQLCIATGSVVANKATLIASGSGSVAANVPMTSLAAATNIVGVLMYETAEA